MNATTAAQWDYLVALAVLALSQYSRDVEHPAGKDKAIAALGELSKAVGEVTTRMDAFCTGLPPCPAGLASMALSFRQVTAEEAIRYAKDLDAWSDEVISMVPADAPKFSEA